MPHQKGFSTLVVIALIAFIVPAVAVVVNQSVRQKPPVPPAQKLPSVPVTSLPAPIVSGTVTLSPQEGSYSLGKVFAVNIVINSPDNVAFVKLTLSFDKTKLNLASPVKTSSDFSTVVRLTSVSIANTTGNLEITTAIPGGKFNVTPKGGISYATLQLKGINKGPAELKINSAKSDIFLTNSPKLLFSDFSANYLIN
jgi:hypothetical protein